MWQEAYNFCLPSSEVFNQDDTVQYMCHTFFSVVFGESPRKGGGIRKDQEVEHSEQTNRLGLGALIEKYVEPFTFTYGQNSLQRSYLTLNALKIQKIWSKPLLKLK
jgi:hypothetical protein